jgi:NAD(P)-dependent dehydrogenase (short-subunit alcohol dehydrogenase family)
MLSVEGGRGKAMRNSQGDRWTEADVPVQRGRTAVITGANTGLGFETARVLAGRGAQVVLACRDLGRAKEAAVRILGGGPQPAGAVAADLHAVRLDLASLASVGEAADEIAAAYGPVDLLINNAGVMMTPYQRTADGFELQLGVNHLGHFALTGLLLGHMLGREGSRVVTVSSNGHKPGRIDFDELRVGSGEGIQSQRRYRRAAAYYQSKLANLMFTYELQRRLEAAQASTQALAAHPGKARTELTRYLPGWLRLEDLVIEQPLGQSAAMGALATLRAAADPGARGGEYYGPGGRGELKGYPRLVISSERARDVEAQQRLWRESERLTGVSYPV